MIISKLSITLIIN